MCHLYPYNNVKLLRKFFYINYIYVWWWWWWWWWCRNFCDFCVISWACARCAPSLAQNAGDATTVNYPFFQLCCLFLAVFFKRFIFVHAVVLINHAVFGLTLFPVPDNVPRTRVCVFYKQLFFTTCQEYCNFLVCTLGSMSLNNILVHFFSKLAFLPSMITVKHFLKIISLRMFHYVLKKISV